ncbi:MAG: sensor histidine kinase [Provencibacterium sp.]|nr:sensor histidine kinase [Provencibacterium sp.]
MSTALLLEWSGLAAPLFAALCFESRSRIGLLHIFPALGMAALWAGFMLFCSCSSLPAPLFLQLGALFLCARMINGGCGEAFFSACLLFGVLCLSNGLSGTVGSCLLSRLPAKWLPAPPLFALFLQLLSALLSAALLSGWRLSAGLRRRPDKRLCLFAAPLLFIGAAEQAVSDALYKNPVVLSWNPGEEALPHFQQPLLLHLLACALLVCTLAALRQLLQAEQMGRALFLQAKEQSALLKEMQLREGQARAFRHDLNNHLLLLRALLRERGREEALRYLSSLQGMAERLSGLCETGNPAADAVLRGKLSLAVKEGISVCCRLKIPEGCPVCDTDWCILLANALDNALAACRKAQQEDRYIRVSGGQRGQFLFLCIENGCAAGLQGFSEGIGLFSIRAAAGKYRGNVEAKLSDKLFRLCILLPIS